MLATIALALTLTGVLGLRMAWHAGRRQRPRAQWGWRCVGLMALAAAIWPWSVLSGDDRGVALWLLIMMLAGIALVIIQAARPGGDQRARRTRQPRTSPDSDTRTAWWRTVWVIALAGPVAGSASLAFGLLLWHGMTTIGQPQANALATSMLFVPMCWAALACWATLPISLRLRSLSLLSAASLAALIAIVGA